MSRRVLATKWRNDVAMGVSPWKRNPHHPVSPEEAVIFYNRLGMFYCWR